jgi:hypothetical protein
MRKWIIKIGIWAGSVLAAAAWLFKTYLQSKPADPRQGSKDAKKKIVDSTANMSDAERLALARAIDQRVKR